MIPVRWRNWRLRGVPLRVQLVILLLASVIVAQISTLALTVLLPPKPAPKYRLTEVALALKGGPLKVSNPRPLTRLVRSAPPSLQSPNWVVSDHSRAELARMVGAPVTDVRILFYSPLPLTGSNGTASLAEQSPSKSDLEWSFGVKLPVPHSPVAEHAQVLEASIFGLAFFQGGPGGGPGSGGAPGGSFPGGGFGNYPTNMPSPITQNQMPQRSELPNQGVSSSSAVVPKASQQVSSQTQTVAPSSPQPQPASAAAPEASPPPTVSAAPPPPGGPGTSGASPSGTAMPAYTPPPPAGGSAYTIPFWRDIISTPLFPEPKAQQGNEPPSTTVSGASHANESIAPFPPPRNESALETSANQPSGKADSETGFIVSPADRGGYLLPSGNDPVKGFFGTPGTRYLQGDFVAALQTSPGQWVTVQPAPETFPTTWQRRIMLWFLVSSAIVVPVGLVFARRLASPLANFADAAERLGRDPSGKQAPLDGPAEIGRAARAFNDMQARLRRYIDDRTAMVGAISHDLRTPLARMRFRLEKLPPKAREGMSHDIAQMEEMISSVLVFIRDASEPSVRERVELRSILECVVDNAALMGGDISLDPGERVPVDVDSLGVERVLTNLIDNALKYGERAHVRVFQDGTDVVTEVEDEGPGLPAGEMERVFMPFYRSDHSRNLNTSGVGLGLAVSRSIARAHGGDIILLPGHQGLKAQLRLPRAAAIRQPAL
ncbi:MAG: HAMP domain-containing sensor histidine kinase [Asticcacaulis sp.]|uniref:ATP-binding protein n=1 Tax=Asticcacaulis sp. TaxID=1872648 RepID=UPI0039E57E85